MEVFNREIISEEEKKRCIAALTADLSLLRLKAGISQDELAGLIGVSRQTYGVVERREREMSWNVFLSLIFIFSAIPATGDYIRSSDAYPRKFTENLSGQPSVADKVVEEISYTYGDILGKLDDQALHAIRTMIMIEYARCTNQSGEAVVKSFDGSDFFRTQPNPDVNRALRNIRGRRKNGK